MLFWSYDYFPYRRTTISSLIVQLRSSKIAHACVRNSENKLEYACEFMQTEEIPHLCDCLFLRNGVSLSAQIEYHQ